MNLNNRKLDQVKTQLIGFFEYCFYKKISSDYKHLVDSFLFDNITLLSDINLKETDIDYFVKYSNDNSELEKYITDSLLFFIESLKETRKKRLSSYRITPQQETTVVSMFMGLTYSGNNDIDYRNVPSALSLATFHV